MQLSSSNSFKFPLEEGRKEEGRKRAAALAADGMRERRIRFGAEKIHIKAVTTSECLLPNMDPYRLLGPHYQLCNGLITTSIIRAEFADQDQHSTLLKIFDSLKGSIFKVQNRGNIN